MHPKVSVVMSVYNGERYLREAVDSILGQTFTDFEFIIINDGSTDNTASILRSYNDQRIILYEQKNKGLTAALNKGIDLSRGEYIARMDADDVSLPERLQRQVEFLDRHERVGLVGTCFYEIGAEGQRVQLFHPPLQDSQLKLELAIWNCFCHGSVMFRRQCIKQVGAYRPEFRWTEDYDLWLRISERFQVANVEAPLYLWRRLSTARSAIGADPTQAHVVIAQDLALERYLHGMDRYGYPASGSLVSPGIPDLSRDEAICYAATLRCWGAVAIWRSDNKTARKLLAMSLRMRPLDFATWILSKDLREVLSQLYASTAFASHASDDLAQVRRNIFPALFLNPSWLKNRGVLSILLESLIGPRAMSRVRHITHRSAKRRAEG